jgi:hypothetical protein
MKPPSTAVVVDRDRAVDSDVAVTLAPDIAAPLGSLTDPVMVPVGSAAYRDIAVERITKRMRLIFTRTPPYYLLEFRIL